MAEIAFILTTVFVAYVIYEVVGDKNKKESEKDTPSTVTPPASAATTNEQEEAEDNSETAVSTNKDETETEAKNSLRNPLTGEVAKIPNNYRFSKRWIKEALVAEALLEKIYKNSELDDETNAKIKIALESLKNMDKYQV